MNTAYALFQKAFQRITFQYKTYINNSLYVSDQVSIRNDNPHADMALHVNGDVKIQNRLVVGGLNTGKETGSDSHIDFKNPVTDALELQLMRTGAGVSEILHKGTQDLKIRCEDAADIELYTNNLIRLKIDDGGEVLVNNNLRVNDDIQLAGSLGIGTASPAEKLHVIGNGRVDGDLYVNGSSGVVLDVNNSVDNAIQMGFDTPGLNSYIKLPAEGSTLFFRDWLHDSIIGFSRGIVNVNTTNFSVTGASSLSGNVSTGQNLSVGGNLTVNGQLNLTSTSTISPRTLFYTNGGRTFGVPVGAIYCKKLNGFTHVPDIVDSFSGTPPAGDVDLFLSNGNDATVQDLGQVGTVTGDIRTGSGRFAEAFYSNADAPVDTIFCFRWHDNIGTPSTSDHGFMVIKCTVDNYGSLFLNGSRILAAADGGSNPWRTLIVPCSYHMAWEYVCTNGTDGGSGLRMYYKIIGC